MENFKIISSEVLEQNDRWLINSFLSKKDFKNVFYKFPLIPLKDLLNERKETLDPQDNPNIYYYYLGLENIQPFTGFLKDFREKSGNDIKSRCKVFYPKDFLFGRLRPLLNKSTIIHEDIKKGICSSEFLVFQVNEEKINPLLLKFIVSSNIVQEQIQEYVAGAALPRIQASDFLSIKIPLLDEEFQNKMSIYVEKMYAEYKYFFDKLNLFEQEFNSSLISSIKQQKLVQI